MITHTVQKGDSLWKISKAHGISLEALIAANPQIPNPDKLDVGMQVMIPSGGQVPGTGASLPMADANPAPTTLPAQMPDMGMGEAPVPSGAQEEKAPASGMMPGGMDVGMTSPAPAPMPGMSTPPMNEPAYPSVPKWEGLWKYVVKNGDSLFKIAKQVGVTLEQLKAANPQVPNPDKIYPGQVLNIPSSGMKPKSGNPGLSPKEQMTSPMPMAPMAPTGVSPLSIKEQLTQPKEMAPMETPITAPVSPMAPMPSPFEINANINYAPHDNVKETNIGYFPHHNQTQQQQAVSPAATGPVKAKQVASPAEAHQHMMYYHMMPHMYYIPVKMKKKHKKCCHKHHKCGCKKHHHHMHAHWAAYHQMMMQHMSMAPKTFYREED
ncbi:MAG: LysM peptidoglycan-binding domain-containing protein [Tumebacillaceae bacterium]